MTRAEQILREAYSMGDERSNKMAAKEAKWDKYDREREYSALERKAADYDKRKTSRKDITGGYANTQSDILRKRARKNLK